VDETERAERDLGLRVSEVRRAQGWTQQQLADRLKIDVRDVRRIEARANVTIATLVRLARALGVEIGALFNTPASRAKRHPGRPAVKQLEAAEAQPTRKKAPLRKR
jgi:transcriptional regulator with XRE-family HTH domain